jgi:FkbM family methyltransferase
MEKMIEILAWIGNRIGKPPGWERVVRLFAAPEKCRAMRDICTAREGVVFLAQPAVPLGWHVAFFGTYEPELRQIFRAVLPVGGIAMDVGANVGWHTLLMAHLVGEGGRVLAAEPNPSVRKRLEDNLKLNRFRQVEVIPHAIADTEGAVDFYGPDADDASSGDGHVITAAAMAQRGVIRVETRRVDAILLATQIERLDLIKIDVEGFEWPVLQGAVQTIAKFRPHIVFEYNAEYAFRGGGTSQLLWEFFEENRYRLFAIGRTWAVEVEPGNWPQCTDIWAVPVS